jgi:hypothetical protein
MHLCKIQDKGKQAFQLAGTTAAERTSWGGAALSPAQWGLCVPLASTAALHRRLHELHALPGAKWHSEQTAAGTWHCPDCTAHSPGSRDLPRCTACQHRWQADAGLCFRKKGFHGSQCLVAARCETRLEKESGPLSPTESCDRQADKPTMVGEFPELQLCPKSCRSPRGGAGLPGGGGGDGGVGRGLHACYPGVFS